MACLRALLIGMLCLFAAASAAAEDESVSLGVFDGTYCNSREAVTWHAQVAISLIVDKAMDAVEATGASFRAVNDYAAKMKKKPPCNLLPVKGGYYVGAVYTPEDLGVYKTYRVIIQRIRMVGRWDGAQLSLIKKSFIVYQAVVEKIVSEEVGNGI